MAEGELSARQKLKIRRATRRGEPDPSELAGELNIVPFLDIVVNLMLFLLATVAATVAVAQTEAQLPAHCRGADCLRDTRGLELSVTVAEDGIFVAAREGRIAPDCRETTDAAIPTVARTNDGYDFAALRSCLTRVSDRYPDESVVILSADPSVPYEHLIGAMDAARGDADRPLFPDVRLSAGVR